MDEINNQNTGEMINTSGNAHLVVDLEDEIKKSFLQYSMAVIVSRALPDVRDGLKPVHRRILYAMHEDGLTPDKAYRKSATTVGNVLGRYHPHGDSSVYDAMVRMSQDFSLRYPLIDGHGNFGSIDGLPAAAYRYTEARLSRMSVEMLYDIEKETVNFVSNYDDTKKEPAVVPSRFPNLLVNGSTGIAVGMATNIPPHNLRETIDAICALIDNPDLEMVDLMDHMKGPDFPTGGVIMGYSGIRAAYATGRGKVIVRAKAEIVEHENGRFSIIISEIPYQVNKLNLVKSIIELSDSKRIDGITSVVDHSSREGMRVVIDLRRDVNAQVVLNQLYRFSQMQTTFGVIMLVLVNGIPKVLTLKQMLQEYIDFQIEIIVRSTQFDLRKARSRAHLLEGLKIASDHIDEVISIIRSSNDIPHAKQQLIERFGLDDIQTDAIVKMRLGQLSGLERQKIEEELEKLVAIITELEAILANNERILEIVKDECHKMRDRYGDDRRTQISAVSGEVDIEDLIPVEESVITLTHFGYIKRQAVDVYKSQRRGGRGIMGMTTRDEDFAETIFTCSTHDYVMFFTSAGRVYRLKGYEIPEGSRTSKGMNVINVLPLEQDEKVSALIHVSEFDNDNYLSMITKNGVIKRTRLVAYSNARKSGLIAIDLRENDELVSVHMTDGTKTLLVATKKGGSIRFKESDARVVGRSAIGVRAIRLSLDDEVIGMGVVDADKKILVVTETGYGRLSNVDEDYRIQNRGGKGLINYHTKKYGDVAGIRMVDVDGDDVILINSEGIIIRIPAGEIRECRRPSKGVRVMRLAEDARIVALAVVPREDENADGDVDDSLDADIADDADNVSDTDDTPIVSGDVSEEIAEKDENAD